VTLKKNEDENRNFAKKHNIDERIKPETSKQKVV
jgi:hypothetical protein